MNTLKFYCIYTLRSIQKFLLFHTIFFSLEYGNFYAQVQLMTCPHDTLSPFPDTVYNANPCLDVNEILNELEGGDHCRLIWINLNVHFFVLNGSSDQLITPTGHKAIESNRIAEELINDANYLLYRNEIQINQDGSVKLCNPFQYVLKGVYVHSVSSKAEVDAVFNIRKMYNLYGINTSSEFNLFISPCKECSGIAGGLGGNISYFNLELLGGNVLNHEWAHTMGLGHSWNEDGLSDTPPIHFDVDRNCDGDFNDAKELNQQCFGKISSSDLFSPACDNIGMSWNGKNWFNGINDCLETTPCPTNPCCLDEYQNNNVMAYNACQCSFSYLQIRRILEQLLSYKCDYINTIQMDRGCWALSAFISMPLPDQSNYGNCSTCFDLSASYNDQKHLIRVYELNGPSVILVYNSGWINTPATKVCFKNYGFAQSTGKYLKANTNYKIELSVGRADDCISPVSYSRYFQTGICSPNSWEQFMNFTDLLIFPNPASTSIRFKFDAFEGEEFSVIAMNQETAHISVLNSSSYIGHEGENELEQSVTSLCSGTYSIFLIGIEHNYYKTFIKP